MTEQTVVEALVERLRQHGTGLTEQLCREAADALSSMAGEPRIVVRWEGQKAFVGKIFLAEISANEYGHWFIRIGQVSLKELGGVLAILAAILFAWSAKHAGLSGRWNYLNDSQPPDQAARAAANVEAVARAICRADGFDPDSEAFVHHADPAKQVAYPYWQEYEAHARAAISTGIIPTNVEAEREAAYREGWKVNAIQPVDEGYDAAYMKAAEDADWLASRARSHPAHSDADTTTTRTSVPLIPTTDMINAGTRCLALDWDMADGRIAPEVYRAMLAARPGA